MTTEIESIGTECIDASDEGYFISVVVSTEATSYSVEDLEEYSIIAQIDYYFQLNALDQKRFRPNLAEAIRNADFVDPYFHTVLEHIGGKVSQNSIIAAIDL